MSEAGSSHGRGGAERKNSTAKGGHIQAVIKFSQTFLKPDSDDSTIRRILDVVYRLVKSEYMYKNIADETFAEQTRPAVRERDSGW